MDLKWTDGKPYERSKRPTREEYEVIQDEMKSNEIEKSAYSSSLNHDENTWDLLNQGLYNKDSEFKLSSKRETLDDKMSGRELVQQIGFNPFLGEANYVNDIDVSNKFLKPINTTQEREKKKNDDDR
jgi:hypothetical protein